MDPLSALSVAAGVVQFVDFTYRLVSGTHAIINSSSGLASDTRTLDIIAKDAKGLKDALATSPAMASSDTTLQALLTECNAIAESLLAVFEKLRAKNTRKWTCFISALRTLWSKGKIADFVDRLGKLQAQISTHMHFLILKHVNMQSVQITSLTERAESLGMEDQNRLEALRDAIVTRLNSLAEEASKTRDDMRHLTETLESNASEPPRAPQLAHLSLFLELTNSFPSAIKHLAEEQSLMASNQEFLESLYFSKIRARQNRIELAHSRTFQWVFQPTIPDGSRRASFHQWLQNGKETFWIQGKAGSGKSTLMKFISAHPTTTELLQKWAGNKRLILSNFFFWHSGTVLQKSREGLLRSLLFEILRKCPEIIPRVSKGNQKGPFQRQGLYSQTNEEDVWSQEELVEVFRTLVACCDETNVMFCFFIDGLDEFEEKRKTHSDVVATLRILDTSQNIKFCISSRPWTVFSDAFGKDPGRLLKLEDLTQNDIRSYVHEKFKGNSQFQLLSVDNPQYTELIEDITRQAQGVFLWVFLVVRDLLEGFSHNDTIRTMRKRLEQFLAELEDFFQHMIDSVSPIYAPHMARTFWMATSVSQPQFLIVYSLLDDISDGLATFATEQLPEVMRDNEVLTRADQMRRRLDGRCKGLLEVVCDNTYVGPYFEYKVDFLHRTVRDFLLGSPKIRRMLEQQRFIDVSGLDRFDNDIWLLPCLSILLALKCAPFKKSRSSVTALENGRVGTYTTIYSALAVEFLKHLMNFAHEAEVNMNDRSALIRLLVDAEKVYDWKRSDCSWPLDVNLFLGLACRADLFSYIERRITPGWFTQPPDSVNCMVYSFHDEPKRPLLSYALGTDLKDRALKVKPWTVQPRIIKLLLDRGADPNQMDESLQTVESLSIWGSFLTQTLSVSSPLLPTRFLRPCVSY
ncbi:hypothetical protein F5Y08DRAFT_29822 [Xylaria arbuscula]|nr:hypothetical protein F5Y08DRAFT_29822 [Xylaria arbuscula]